MKNISLSISKTSILDEVALNSEYAGAKSGSDSEIYDRVAVIPQDNEILSRFWTQMCAQVIRQLKEFIGMSQLSESSLSLTLLLSGAYDDALTPSVKDDINAAIAAGVTARWFRYTFPDKLSDWESQSARALDSALSKLCMRRRPIRS